LRANRIEAAISASSKRKENTMSNETTTKSRPTYRVYNVAKGEDEKSLWTEIGAAWPHKDGKGFNLKLTATPVEGAAIVLRVAKAKEELSA
jgi:hypothetical protein